MPIHPRSLNRWIASLLLVIPLVVIPARAEVKQGNAVVMTISGQAESVSATGSSRILKTGDILKPGDTIKTGADSEVDLLLEHVESTVGLSSGSILKLERLSYEDTRYGRITQTRLGLAAGELSGKVHKQLAGARFEIVTPKEVASVRGTIFFINSQTGDVHVTEGSVQVTIQLNGTGLPPKTVTVNAGQSLFIPNQFNNVTEYNNLHATATPPNLSADKLEKLAQKDKNYQKYVRPGPGTVGVTETFNASTKGNGQIIVVKPPTSTVVSP